MYPCRFVRISVMMSVRDEAAEDHRVQTTPSIETRRAPVDSLAAATTPPKKRDGSIETLRGVAILLVVVYHALADLPAGPAVTADLDVYGYAGESLRFVRMPLLP